MAQHARVGKTTRLSEKITINQVSFISQDIQNWKNAINSARAVISPRRRQLYQLYDNLLIDGHLESVIDKRTISITNKEINFFTGDKGEIDETVSKEIIHTPWFFKFLELGMSSIAMGPSLIELIPDQGKIVDVALINRANVVPEKSFLAWHSSNLESGINYLTDPKYKDYLIEVGDPKGFGKMMTAAQYIIYKRGGFGDWAQFAEIFGMPFRVAKYDQWNDKDRKALEAGLEQMGGAAHLVIPKDTEIEFIESKGQGKADIYKELVAQCNSEISKIFLGQTMTTDDGSSKSQAGVHKEVEEEITLSDMQRMEHVLNWQLKPKLEALGYKLPGRFSFVKTKTMSLSQQINIDVLAASQVPIPDSYWYEKYGYPKPSAEELKVLVDRFEKQGSQPNKPDEDAGEVEDVGKKQTA